MFKTALKFLKRKKRDVLIMLVATVVLSIFSVTSFITAGDISLTKKEEGLSAYGSFIVGGTVKSKDELAQADMLKIGTYEILTIEKIYNTKIAIGKADSDFFELVGCRIVEGRQPEHENEIAVQRFVLNALNRKINDKISLNTDDGEKDFIITGILNNYSMNLSTNEFVSESLYPAVILSDSYESNTEKLSYIADYKDTSVVGVDEESEVFEIAKYIDSDLIQYSNDNLFNEGFRYCKEIERLSVLFIVIIFLMSCLIFVMLYFFFFKNTRKLSATFNCLGGMKQVFFLLLQQLIMITVLAFLVSVFVYVIIFNVAGWQHSYISTGIIFLLVWYMVYTVVMLTVCGIYLKYISKNSIRKNMNYELHIRNEQRVVDRLLMVKGFVKYIPVFIVIFFCIFFIKTSEDVFTGMPDYQLVSQEVGVQEIKNGYVIERNTGYVYDIDEVNKIFNKYPGIQVNLEPCTDNNMAVVDAGDGNDFIKNWQMLYNENDTNIDYSDSKMRWPAEADKFTPINNSSFVILSHDEYTRLCRECNIDSREDDIIMYIPCESDADIDVSRLGFAGFITDSDLKFKKYNSKISSVLCQRDLDTIMGNIGDYTELINTEQILFFLDYSRMHKYPMVKGYRYVSVYTKNLGTDRGSLNDDMGELQSGIVGGKLYSKSEDETKAEIYNAYLKRTGVSVITIAMCICITFIIINVINFIKYNRRRIGIFMVLGKSHGNIINERFLVNVKAFLFSAITGVVITVLTAIYSGETILCVFGCFTSIGLMLIVLIVDTIIFRGFFRRVRIKDCIYKEN